MPLLDRIRAYNTDTHYNNPHTEYTLYFWKLHFLYHLMSLFKKIIGKAKSNLPTMRKIVFTKMQGVPCVLLQACEVFLGYLDLYMPKAPFSDDTLCWDQIKILLKNCIGVWIEIIYELVLGDCELLEEMVLELQNVDTKDCQILALFRLNRKLVS